MKTINISWWIIVGLVFQAGILKVKGYLGDDESNKSKMDYYYKLISEKERLIKSISKESTESEIDNFEYLRSFKRDELYNIENIYNNTYRNPVYYLNQVNKYKNYVKRNLETDYDESAKSEDDFFLFGNQLDGFSLFVYETLVDIAFSSTRGVKLSAFYYYDVNFFDVVKDTEVNALISTGYSAL